MINSIGKYSALSSGPAIGVGVYKATLRAAADLMIKDPLYWEPTADRYHTLTIHPGDDPERIAGCRAYGSLCVDPMNDEVKTLLNVYLNQQPHQYPTKRSESTHATLIGGILSAYLLNRIDIHLTPQFQAFKEGFDIALGTHEEIKISFLTFLDLNTFPQFVMGIWSPLGVITTPDQIIPWLKFVYPQEYAHGAVFKAWFLSFLRGIGYPKGRNAEGLGLTSLFSKSSIAQDPGFRARLLCHALSGSPLMPLDEHTTFQAAHASICAMPGLLPVRGLCGA
ncbi:hypothetical protein BOTBODRAFT_43495 [Botryobasidium botryosum FD-172 SS1]|uniref:Uncharacterized protein n=1 Tax=Botryobasidium botryosum (strain FD-172 SS1) TaxID=930990 RepID=A0A067MPF5_BOTB1|nr:hypothetical protein BOTBODRAFT_43495 [Botryobasidium botryosum FD-172 SS1]